MKLSATNNTSLKSDVFLKLFSSYLTALHTVIVLGLVKDRFLRILIVLGLLDNRYESSVVTTPWRNLSLIKLSNQQNYLESSVKQAADCAFRERRSQDEEMDRSGAGSKGKGATVSEDIAAVSDNVLATSPKLRSVMLNQPELHWLTKSNPKLAPSWIAAARVQAAARNQVVARKIMVQGCIDCPRGEDTWLETANINTEGHAKFVSADAVIHLPHLVKIWHKAVELEHEIAAKEKGSCARHGVPTLVKLWKEAVNLDENLQDARILPPQAVQVVPFSDVLWLALDRLEREQGGKALDRVELLMSRGVSDLKKNGADLPRVQWIKEAKKYVEDEDQRDIWIQDLQSSLANGSVQTACSTYSYALNIFLNKAELWRKAADLEKCMGQLDPYLNTPNEQFIGDLTPTSNG
ncbi:hypothetical protein MJO28_009844 [Puccinia striiformis f. sp. tritici]|uniref:Uncharacterized protein n=1 Tax=Puccinia striiformis f. sp. tritici TaxID=168172 RepID=A0ACC0EAF4_9BASI|nr:hypothetical protein MJO28_009844 [Puccinia striiformis f. sp. tritici]